MLVVVHHGDIHLSFEPFLDFETLGSLYVLKVDSSECRAEGFDNLDEFFRVGFVDFDVEAVEACEYLEEKSLSFHHRFSGEGSDVAESEDCCAV